jgi:hypothetical protein
MTNSLLGQHGRLGVFDLAAGVVGIGGVVGGLGGGGDLGLDVCLVAVDYRAIVEVQPQQHSGDEADCADGVELETGQDWHQNAPPMWAAAASRTITRTVP